MRKLTCIFGIALFFFGCAGFDRDDLLEAQKLVRGSPTDHTFQKLLGDEFSDLEEYRNAIASYKKAIRIKPDYAEAYWGIGYAYDELEEYQNAIVSYKKAIQIKPDYADAHWGLGYTYENMGRDNEAIQKYKDALGYKPKSTIARDLLNNLEKKNYEEATLKNPQDATAHYNLGVVYYNSHYYDKAIAYFKKAIRIKPDFYQYYHLGNTYRELAKFGNPNEKYDYFQKAVSAYKEALRINPNNTLARNSLNQLEQKLARAKPSPPARQPSKPVFRQPSVKQQLLSSGTGFLFSSRDYIITNWHVVKGAGSIEVKFPDGEVIKAKVLAKDSQNDIAVLKLSQSTSTQIPDLNFGDSSKVRPGDKVFTIGYPASSILGKNQKITDGIVSSITGVEDDPTMFQITVPIQPGNSGGPLFNENGEVIGITTASLSLNAIRSLGAVPQNINYAIKSSFVNNLLTTIPKTLLSNRGIIVVPSKPGNSLADFFERVSNNIVLIEAKE